MKNKKGVPFCCALGPSLTHTRLVYCAVGMLKCFSLFRFSSVNSGGLGAFLSETCG